MKLKMKILIVMGSLMLMVFAVNLGVAYAHPGAGGFENAPVNPNIAITDHSAALEHAGIDILQLNADKVPVCGGHIAGHL